ncbi:MAG: arabinose transporter [Desulfarculales bacterium]|jgi:MFS family permease|nr:arabinose transporter [Desulfarculales bacterium]
MRQDTRYLLWNTTSLLFAYMVVAIPLPVISVFVTHELGFPNSLGGLAVGVTYLTAIFSRGFSGRLADRIGGKACMAYGLPIYALACVVCFAAAMLTLYPVLGLGFLLAGRLILGVGDSLVSVGMLSWNIALLGTQRSGVVFSLVGACIYGAIAAGGPLGMLCVDAFGFSGLMLLCIPLPLLGRWMISPIPAALPQTFDLSPPVQSKAAFFRVAANIWRQGVVTFSQGVGFAALGAFIFLYFANQGWRYAGLGLTCFGAGFVLMRLVFGSLPDKLGGMHVAMVSLIVAACGQFLLWTASSAEMALAGAFLTGIGCSLIYPSMGAESVRMVRPELQGTAVGAFAVFQDVAYGITAPVAGLFADRFGYSAVFMLGFIAALSGLLVAILTVLQRANKNDG